VVALPFIAEQRCCSPAGPVDCSRGFRRGLAPGAARDDSLQRSDSAASATEAVRDCSQRNVRPGKAAVKRPRAGHGPNPFSWSNDRGGTAGAGPRSFLVEQQPPGNNGGGPEIVPRRARTALEPPSPARPLDGFRNQDAGIARLLWGVMQVKSRLMRRGRPGPSARPVPRTGRQGRRRPRRPC
jgi:hypothetical protein